MSVVIRWNPTNSIFTLDEIINQMLEWTSDVSHEAKKAEMGSAWVPAADMYETDDAIIIHIELAGIEKDSLEILFQDDSLFLRGSRPLSTQMQSAKIHRIERMYGYFRRVFRIPQPVDSHHVSASYEQGVLKITLLKSKPSVTDRVNIPITK
jgi:HSP20 family protein